MTVKEPSTEPSLKKNVHQENAKIEFDVYKCDHDGHIIVIAEDPEKNLAEDLIRCPYHKCSAELDYSVKMRKNLIEDIFWERIDP